MKAQIKHPQDWVLTPAVYALLQRMFADYVKVSLEKEFTEGQSGTQVFLAIPYRSEQEPELPVVVKLGPQELIQQEWTAAQHTRRKLPGFVEIAGEPSYLEPKIEGDIPYGGLRYELAGQGLFRTESLRMYCRHAAAADLWSVLDKRLLPQLRRIWRENLRLEKRRKVHASYDRVLPVNLILEPLPAANSQPPAPAVVFNAGQMQTEGVQFVPLHRDTLVRLEGFVVTELERHQHSITFNLPQTGETRTASFRLRLREMANCDDYRLGEPAPVIMGRVVATRQELLLATLHSEADLPAHLNTTTLPLPEKPQVHLPNPLLAWPTLLQEELPMKIGTVHGDLNMGNVLIDPEAHTVQIIDCGHARRDHALYDLLRLELETVLHPLAAAFFQAGQSPSRIYEFYSWLDHVTRSDPHDAGHFALPHPLQHELSALATPFILLTTIRHAACELLVTPGNWREYYTGLALYLSGALKFANLDRAPAGQKPKALAFWGAATILHLLAGSGESSEIEWELVDLNAKANASATQSGAEEKRKTEVKIDQRSGGVFLEGNQAVNIQGDLISGGTVNKAAFHGPVTGPVHTGSGDVHYVSGMERRSTSDLAQLLAELRAAVTASAPKPLIANAVGRIDDLEEAIPELDLDTMAATLKWFQRRLPGLAGNVEAVIRHPAVVQTVKAAGDSMLADYRSKFGS